jgi:hypothetical protein
VPWININLLIFTLIHEAVGMATKKLKLYEDAICEILVADCDSESGAEVSDVEEGFNNNIY